MLDRLIAELAARQHGVVAVWQLTEVGVDDSAIRRRVADGRLHRIHQGVYAVGHAKTTREARWMAAVLALGPAALLSHRAAAALWDLRRTDRRAIDVTTPGRKRRSRPGIDVHASARLHPDDRARIDSIPVTSVARTLLDLADVSDAKAVRRAYERAEALRLLDVRAIAALLDRSNGRRGVGVLRALLDYDPAAAARTKSELELMFLDLIRAAGLPTPQVNVLVEGFEVDAHWPRAGLVVELDSYEHHADRRAFERDRVKIRELRLAGYEVLPVTYRQLEHDPGRVIAAVRAMLARNTPIPNV